MSEEVLELSVQETNKLRAKLGLAPLRMDDDDDGGGQETTPADAAPDSPSDKEQQDEEVLEMSVADTNKLRAKLGLLPLREGGDNSSSSKIQDAGLVQKQKEEELRLEEERERLQEDVQKGIASTFTEQSLGTTGGSDAKSWAEQLRNQKEQPSTTTTATTTTTTKKKAKKSKSKKSKLQDDYDESDLKGINVAHAMSELEAGSTTVMTLADAPLLQTDEHNAHLVKGLNQDANTPQLENVNLAEQAKQSDGLKKKRQLELGMGRSGGYAGFDDDEFVELGGTGAPARMARGQQQSIGDSNNNNKNNKSGKGFTIGEDYYASQDAQRGGSDLFASQAGKAVSLEPSQADVQASDFMTEQEDEELRAATTASSKKKHKKKDKFDKKKKKKDKKEKKKHQRRRVEEDDEESEDETHVHKKILTNNNNSNNKSLLDELEETAEDAVGVSSKKNRKRTRGEDDDEDEEMEDVSSSPTVPKKENEQPKDEEENKRAKYEAIMAKGNERTQKAFGDKQKEQQTADEDEELEDEPDDAFLNAALAKARRLKKLREMSGAKGAEAVASAVQSQTPEAPSMAEGKGMTFSVDDTREFTRALRARTEQQGRKQNKPKKEAPTNTMTTVKQEEDNKPKVETVKQEDTTAAAAEEDMDMEELAKDVKEDANKDYLDGSTGSTVAVGRGLAGVMNLFKQTGDFTRKNAGKEELRGRAKDERTYEDYEALDLKNVVKIDGRYATDKDRDMASREVKLEYRDKHGRLLTRKEAYRDLCYQFHGHGSSKRKEEKRQKQMQREQAEARMASQQLAGADGGPGMLGALKATQKASGKAFVIHKT